MVKYFIPLILVLILGGFLYAGLFLNPKEVPSPFINKPAPDFSSQNLHKMAESFSNSDMMGKAWLLNVWASWCVACRQEHPILVNVARDGKIPLYGLNYKDAPRDARQWLQQHGDPYLLSVVDYQGKIGIDYGVYGVPETFVIDKKGIIRHKVIGPISRSSLGECVLPLYEYLAKVDTVDMDKMNEAKKECA
jgi:cytochrome c biogenesis protein CcmG/thiol:disulfide interchange protein DsbE